MTIQIRTFAELDGVRMWSRTFDANGRVTRWYSHGLFNDAAEVRASIEMHYDHSGLTDSQLEHSAKHAAYVVTTLAHPYPSYSTVWTLSKEN